MNKTVQDKKEVLKQIATGADFIIIIVVVVVVVIVVNRFYIAQLSALRFSRM